MEFDPVSYAMGQAAAGQSVEVEALSATENKTYTAPSGKAYSPVTVNVPNPNSVTTITGTLSNPWGDIAYYDIASALVSGGATVEITYDASAIGAGSGRNYLVLTSQSGTTNLNGAYLSDQQQAAYMILFAADGSVSAAYVFDGANVVDIAEYASVITTQTVITWHPMT